MLQTFEASNKLRITTTNNKLQIFRTNNNNQCNTDNQAYIKQTTNSKIPWSVKQDVQTFQAIIKRNNKYSGTKGLKMFKFQCKQAADLRMRDLTSKLGDKSLTSQTFLLYLCNLCNWVPILNTLCIRTKRKRYKQMPFKINTNTRCCILKKMQLPTLRRWQTLPSCLSRFSLTPLIGPCRAHIITPQFKMTSMMIKVMIIKWLHDDYLKMR